MFTNYSSSVAKVKFLQPFSCKVTLFTHNRIESCQIAHKTPSNTNEFYQCFILDFQIFSQNMLDSNKSR